MTVSVAVTERGKAREEGERKGGGERVKLFVIKCGDLWTQRIRE